MRTLGTLAALAALALLTACGNTTTSSPNPGHTHPACPAIWNHGQTLPSPYAGCVTKTGNLEQPVWYHCPDGRRYAGHNKGSAYALEGGPVVTKAGELAHICD